MAKAFRNLLFVCFIVFIFLFLGWFYLYNRGQLITHTAFKTQFFKKQKELIAFRGESTDFTENTLPAFEAAAKLSQDIILWADVMISQDGVPVVTRYQDLSIYGAENSFVPLMNFAELEKIDVMGNHLLSLKELVEKFSTHRFVLNLADDGNNIEDAVIRAISYNDKTERFLITSDRDKVIKSTRKLAPMLLYGTSTPQVTQLMILGNLFLENIAPLDSDVLLVPQVDEKVRGSDRVHLNEKMITEAHRRSLKVFAGLAHDETDLKALEQMQIDGIISDHPSALKNFFQQ